MNKFEDWKFSLYKSICENSKTRINRDFVLELFGSKNEFINYHKVMHDELGPVVME